MSSGIAAIKTNTLFVFGAARCGGGIMKSQVIDEIKMKYSNYLFNEIICDAAAAAQGRKG